MADDKRLTREGDAWYTDSNGYVVGVRPCNAKKKTQLVTSDNLDDYLVVPGPLAATTLSVSNYLVVPKVSGSGIKVDPVDPTFNWRDIIGDVNPKTSGANSPIRTVYNGGVLAGEVFIAGDLCDFVWHIPHDYVPGTDLLWHVHWSHTGTTITGNVVFDLFYETGKRGGLFTTEKNLTITYATVDLATTPRLFHFVHETAMTAAAATTILIPASAIEVDGIITGTMRLTTLPTLGGSGKLFIHTSDIHYQSSNIGTKLSAFPYYG